MKKTKSKSIAFYSLLSVAYIAVFIHGLKVWSTNRFPDNNMIGVRPTVYYSILCAMICGSIVFYTIITGESHHKYVRRTLKVGLVILTLLLIYTLGMSPQVGFL